MFEKAFLVEGLRTFLRPRCVGLQSEMTTDGLSEGRLTGGQDNAYRSLQ
jgi:hypothetical protein